MIDLELGDDMGLVDPIFCCSKPAVSHGPHLVVMESFP